MRPHSTLASLGALALLASCSALPRLPGSQPPTPVKFAAVLQPGCLLPPPNQFPDASSDGATLSLRITPSGKVASATVARSTGSPSLDTSLAAAAERCSFAPAYTVNAADHTRTLVDDDYTLSVSWSRGRQPQAMQRCFTPGYPHAARRAEEEGNVFVQFRLSSSSGQVEIQIRPDSAAGQVIRPLSHRAVEACLAHEDVRAALPPNKWMTALYSWRLD